MREKTTDTMQRLARPPRGVGSRPTVAERCTAALLILGGCGGDVRSPPSACEGVAQACVEGEVMTIEEAIEAAADGRCVLEDPVELEGPIGYPAVPVCLVRREGECAYACRIDCQREHVCVGPDGSFACTREPLDGC